MPPNGEREGLMGNRQTLAVLVTASVLAAVPAHAQHRADSYREAPYPGNGAQAHGVFAGATVRLHLGRKAKPAPQIALRIAPHARSNWLDRPTSSRIGEGLALTFTGEQSPRVLLAGRSLREVGNGTLPDGRRNNLSTLSTIAIVGGVAMLGVATWFFVRVIEPSEQES